jgi:uncharacterized membrane protein YedE/YeeE
MKRVGGALAAGLLFGVGLTYSGMVDPRNVVGFLDVAGRWNPNLAGVMIGAILVHATLLRLLGWRATPPSPGRRGGVVDRRLLLGSAIFGVGWGLSGYCPGPAVVALGFGAGRALLFVAALVAGGLAADAIHDRGARLGYRS